MYTQQTEVRAGGEVYGQPQRPMIRAGDSSKDDDRPTVSPTLSPSLPLLLSLQKGFPSLMSHIRQKEEEEGAEER